MKTKQKTSTFRSGGVATPLERSGRQSEAVIDETRAIPSRSKRTDIPTTRSKSELLLKEIRRKTQRLYSAEQKIIIVMEGIRGEVSVAELCRRYGISETTYYKWNKEFVEAGKKRLAGDATRQATSTEVDSLRKENQKLKESLADLVIRYDIVKKMAEIYERYSSEDI